MIGAEERGGGGREVALDLEGDVGTFVGTEEIGGGGRGRAGKF